MYPHSFYIRFFRCPKTLPLFHLKKEKKIGQKWCRNHFYFLIKRELITVDYYLSERVTTFQLKNEKKNKKIYIILT